MSAADGGAAEPAAKTPPRWPIGRSLMALAPWWYLACMVAAYAIAWAHLGKQPDGNHAPAAAVTGGLFYFTAQAAMLATLFAIPLCIGWGVREKQWRWSLILVAGIAVQVAVFALDPLSIRSWFLY